jgi:cyclohexadieny/prephenate dehydrogenase
MNSSGPIFDRIALIGVGLIGSSIAHAARRAGLTRHIAAYVPRAETRARAEKIGFADSLHDELEPAVTGADLVVLATPVGTYAALASALAPHLKPGAILTDVGSVKGEVVKEVGPHVPAGVHFIPGHPVAGTEQSGPEAGFAELFDGRWCILTPTPETDPEALEKLKEFWRRCGSAVETMDAKHHDLVLAITSHVPHLIAYNIVGTAADMETVIQSEVIKYSASGFRDFTRIAGSSPEMWRDISLANRDALLGELDAYLAQLTSLRAKLAAGDGAGLEGVYANAQRARHEWIQAIETAEPRPAPDSGK